MIRYLPIISSLLLAACAGGGGGGSPPPAAPPQAPSPPPITKAPEAAPAPKPSISLPVATPPAPDYSNAWNDDVRHAWQANLKGSGALISAAPSYVNNIDDVVRFLNTVAPQAIFSQNKVADIFINPLSPNQLQANGIAIIPATNPNPAFTKQQSLHVQYGSNGVNVSSSGDPIYTITKNIYRTDAYDPKRADEAMAVAAGMTAIVMQKFSVNPMRAIEQLKTTACDQGCTSSGLNLNLGKALAPASLK